MPADVCIRTRVSSTRARNWRAHVRGIRTYAHIHTGEACNSVYTQTSTRARYSRIRRCVNVFVRQVTPTRSAPGNTRSSFLLCQILSQGASFPFPAMLLRSSTNFPWSIGALPTLPHSLSLFFSLSPSFFVHLTLKLSPPSFAFLQAFLR